MARSRNTSRKRRSTRYAHGNAHNTRVVYRASSTDPASPAKSTITIERLPKISRRVQPLPAKLWCLLLIVLVCCCVALFERRVREVIVYSPRSSLVYASFGDIPRVLHQTYDRWESIPPCCQRVIEKNRTRLIGWTYRFYSEEGRRHVCHEYGEGALAAYETLSIGAEKADLFRYCALYLYGGMYLDIKTSVTHTERGGHDKRVDDLLEGETRLLYAVWPLTWRTGVMRLAASPMHAVTSVLMWPRAPPGGHLDGVPSDHHVGAEGVQTGGSCAAGVANHEPAGRS